MPTSSTNLTTKVATLTLPTADTRLTALVWPSPSGTLLFLAELNLSAQPANEFTAALTQVLETKWKELSPLGLPADAALEQIVLALNQVLLLKGRLIGNPLAPRYHLGVAIMQNKTIALSSLGHLSTLLINTEHLTNVAQNSALGRGPRITKPTFENLSCGQIEAGETFVISSLALLDYFSIDKVKYLFSNHLPGVALREIETFAAKLPHHSPLGIIALKFQPPAVVDGTAPSLEHLQQTKAKTAELLKPSLRSWFKRSRSSRRAPPPLPEVSQITSHQVEPDTPTIKRVALQARWQSLNYNFQRLAAKLVWLKSRSAIKEKLSQWLAIKVAAWQSLNATRQIIMVVALILLIIFSQSIVSAGKNKLKQIDSQAFNRLVTRITQNATAAQSALIYRDDAKAQTYLETAQKILDTLPRSNSAQQQQYQAVADNLRTLQQRLNRETEITQLIAWRTLPAGQNPPANQMALISGSIWVSDTSGNLTGLNQAGQTIKTVKLPTDFRAARLIVAAANKILLQNNNSEQAIIDPASGAITKLAKPQPMADAVFYLGKLYYLDEKLSNIYKTSFYPSSLSGGIGWLRNKETLLAGAKSLTVDGSIYVAGTDKIEKYSRGAKQTFSVQSPSGLTPYDLIRTNSESDYLYVLNRTKKAIILLDKQGKLVLQLIFSGLTNLNDLAIDNAKQIIYITSENSIYKVDIAPYLK